MRREGSSGLNMNCLTDAYSAFLSYLSPVRDEEAESQRKAKSRHARQTRRSTQGVTLTDLKEAQKTYSMSPQGRQMEDGDSLEDRSCLRKGLMEDRGVQISLTESMEPKEITHKWSKIDEQGNTEPRLETHPESPAASLSYSSSSGSCVPPGSSNTSNSCYRGGERWWTDENQNPVEEAAHLNFSTNQQQRQNSCDAEASYDNIAEV
ncbi:hypothetical protein LDENG_00060150 [Lucifuga dentata]|nr:hypothetical protein LDENG_00060150 [Lucifuga dentata]